MKILGIDFFNGSIDSLVQLVKSGGGLLVVPAAPALITIKKDSLYYKSLLTADIVIADSSYMTILWRLIRLSKINKISGLAFLKAFFADEEVKQTTQILLVDPRKKEAEANFEYLKKLGFRVSNEISYVAPIYNYEHVEDKTLLDLVEQKKPKYIIVNLGGGIQEKLGAYLKNNLTYKPAIICTGAAIAFLTGHQASIPGWAEKLCIAWLFRCIENPKTYIPRYLKAFKLLPLLVKYGEKMPQ